MSQPTKKSAAAMKSAFHVSFEIPKKSWNVLTGKTTSIVTRIPVVGQFELLKNSLMLTSGPRFAHA